MVPVRDVHIEIVMSIALILWNLLVRSLINHLMSVMAVIPACAASWNAIFMMPKVLRKAMNQPELKVVKE